MLLFISIVLILATINGSLFSELLFWATSCDNLGLLVLLGSGSIGHLIRIRLGSHVTDP
jgi:hypothetical protein